MRRTIKAVILGLCVLAAIWLFATTGSGAQHAVDVFQDGNSYEIVCTSGDTLGAVSVLLRFDGGVVEDFKLGPTVAESLYVTFEDHFEFTVASFPLYNRYPPGKFVLGTVTTDVACKLDTFTNSVGSGLAFVTTDCNVIYPQFKFHEDGTDVEDGEDADADGDEESNVPEEFGLNLYPNPFNPSTVVKYMIPEECAVRISAYNILGQNIEDLIDGTQVLSPGSYMINWNPSGISSGVYFLRMVTPKGEITKKVVLMK